MENLQRLPERRNDELYEQLEDLTHAEQQVLLDLLRRSKYDKHGRVELDGISIVHGYLSEKSGDFTAITDNYSEMPEIIRSHPNCHEAIKLSDEILPIEKSYSDIVKERVSARDYQRKPVTLQEVTTLLDQAFGFREYKSAYDELQFPFRTAPSSGGLQAVELYFIANDVDSLEPGLYHYQPIARTAELIDLGFMRMKVAKCCAFQGWLSEAPVIFGVVCDLSKMRWKYGKRCYRMIHMDAGIVSQNLHMAATGMGFGSCMIAGFNDDEMNELFGLDGRDEYMGLLVSVGHKQTLIKPTEE